MYLIMAGSINMFLDDDRRTPSSISDRNRETMGYYGLHHPPQASNQFFIFK